MCAKIKKVDEVRDALVFLDVNPHGKKNELVKRFGVSIYSQLNLLGYIIELPNKNLKESEYIQTLRAQEKLLLYKKIGII